MMKLIGGKLQAKALFDINPPQNDPYGEWRDAHYVHPDDEIKDTLYWVGIHDTYDAGNEFNVF